MRALLLLLTVVLVNTSLGREMLPPQPLDPKTRREYQEAAKKHVQGSLGLKMPLPKRGHELVRSEEAAIQIHEAVTSSIFGKEHIEGQRPFFALREGAFWVVFGSLPMGYLGGTAITVIRAANGEIVGLVHEQ